MVSCFICFIIPKLLYVHVYHMLFNYQPLEVTNWTPFAISGNFRTFEKIQVKWSEMKWKNLNK